MGIAWTKKHSRTGDYCLWGQHAEIQQTQDQFLSLLNMTLSSDDREQLRLIFKMISVGILQETRYLYTFIKAKSFNKLYKKAFETKYNRKLSRKELADRVRYHCFAILITHLQIMENIHTPNVDFILKEVAFGHASLTNKRSDIRVHSELLPTFLRKELRKFINPDMKQALLKYFYLINTRLQVLTDYSSIPNNETILYAMKLRKTSISENFEGISSLRQIYLNRCAECSSTNCEVPHSIRSSHSFKILTRYRLHKKLF